MTHCSTTRATARAPLTGDAHHRHRAGDRAPRRRRLVHEAQPAPHGPRTRSCSSVEVDDGAGTTIVLDQGLRLLDARDQRVRRAWSSPGWVHGAVRQLRRGHRRGPRQGPGRRAAQDPGRHHRAASARRRQHPSRSPRPSCASATSAWSSAGEIIPGDGEIIEGIASVDESAITGESAPVIRESGGDRSRGHRRHPGALGPDRRADHGRTRARRSSTA